jgi:hypothetical protein
MIRAVAALAALAASAAPQQLPRQQPRLRPAGALSSQTQGGPTSVNVLDFGADPHSHNDSTAAFNEAFKAAQLIGNGMGGADDGACVASSSRLASMQRSLSESRH